MTKPMMKITWQPNLAVDPELQAFVPEHVEEDVEPLRESIINQERLARRQRAHEALIRAEQDQKNK